MISQNITKLIVEAMKARDAVRVSTLRGLSSELKNAKINIYDPNASEQRELTEQEEIAIIRKEVKKRKEAIEIYEKAGIEDKAIQEKTELAILTEFLPPEMSEKEITKIIEDVFAEVNPVGMQDMGKVIGQIKQKAPNVEGKLIADLVTQRLSG